MSKIDQDNFREEVEFFKLLITKCQEEFESGFVATITDLKERQDEIQNCSELKKKKILTEILDYDLRRIRYRSLANIKLISEFYKIDMVKTDYIIKCIDALIKKSDDESLELLCALVRNTGEQIEREAINNDNIKQYAFLDNLFAKLKLFTFSSKCFAEQKDPDVKKTSSKIRFMVMDVIDMRFNGWKSRRKEYFPKRIDEIHLDIRQEDLDSRQSAGELEIWFRQYKINKKKEKRELKLKGWYFWCNS